MRLQDYVSALTRIPCDEASQTITRILVVEDFAPFRVFISSFLAQDPDLQIVWESADGTEAVRWARELSPDLILMDTGLPGVLNGIEVAREIGQSISESKIAFLHMEISAEVVQSTLELDALGQVPESGLEASYSQRFRLDGGSYEVHLRGPFFPALERRLFLGLWRIIFQKLLDCFRDVFLLLVRFGLWIQSFRRNSPPYESFQRRIVHAEV
jgi:CheY-like chemotaxis protein